MSNQIPEEMVEKFFRGRCPDCGGNLEHNDFYEQECNGYYHSMDKYICLDCGLEIAEFFSTDPEVKDNGVTYCG